MSSLTRDDITNPQALKAYDDWKPEEGKEKTVDEFLTTVGKQYADSYNKTSTYGAKEGQVAELGGENVETEIEDTNPVEFPKGLTPELAKQIDEDVNELEEEYTLEKFAQIEGAQATFAMYNLLKEDFKLGEEGSLISVAFQLAQCEARMGMFDSLGKGNYAQLLKDSMDGLAMELATNQMIFDTLKMDPTSLSEANRLTFYKKHEAEIKAFLDGKGKTVKLSPEVVTATLAMHHRAVSLYGDKLQKQYGAPTLCQRVKSLDARLTKRYGKWWNAAKTAVTSLTVGAVFGPGGIAVLTAYRTYEKFREYKHEAKVNEVSLLEHLKKNPMKIAEAGLSLGTAVFAGGAALGFESAFTAKLITSGLRGVANESFFKSVKARQYKKAFIAFSITGLATGAGLFAHSEVGHNLMQNVYGKVGGFLGNIFKHKEPEPTPEPTPEPEPEPQPEPTPAPKPKSGGGVRHIPNPKPVAPAPEPAPEPTPAPEPQYDDLHEKLLKDTEHMRSDEIGSLMDEGVNSDSAYVANGLNQGLRESRDFVTQGFNKLSDTGIEEMPNSDAIFEEMNTRGTNFALKCGHSINNTDEALWEMQNGYGGDTMRPNPWMRDPTAWDVNNSFAFGDTMTGYGWGGYGYDYYSAPLPVYVPVSHDVVVVHDYDVSYGDNAGNYTASNVSSTPSTVETPGTDTADTDTFNAEDIAVEEAVEPGSVVNSSLSENVYTEFNEEDGTFSSEVYDINGNLLENREGDISYDEHGNKVTSYLAYKKDYPEGEMPENPDGNCMGRTSIVEDRDTHQIIAKQIEDSDGNLVAEGQDFIYYKGDDNLSAYTMHNFADDTYDHHHFQYNESNKPIRESISKVSSDGVLISTEDIYNTTDENGNTLYMHAMTDGDNEVVFSHQIFTDNEGEHEFYAERGKEAIETVTKDGNIVWDKVTDTDGNSVRTDYEYDKDGAETSRTVRIYDKDNNLLGMTKVQGDIEQKFDAKGNLISQTPPVEKPTPTVEHHTAHSAQSSSEGKSTASSTKEEVTTSTTTTQEETSTEQATDIKQKAEGVKKRLLAGKITMVAGGTIAAASVATAKIAARKQQKGK